MKVSTGNTSYDRDERFQTDRDVDALIFAGKNGKTLDKVTVRAILVERDYLGLKDKTFEGKTTKDVPTEGWAFEVPMRNPATGRRVRVATDSLTRSNNPERANMAKWWAALSGEALREGDETPSDPACPWVIGGKNTPKGREHVGCGCWDAWLDVVVGKTCLMELTRHVSGKGNAYPRIGALIALPEGMDPLPWQGDQTLVEVGPSEADSDLPF